MDVPSSSDTSVPLSPSSSSSKKKKSCLICCVCSAPAHGLHFGVVACRACAAFYRRAVVMQSRHKCRSGQKNCRVDRDIRNICRWCRFQKCVEKGMKEENIRAEIEEVPALNEIRRRTAARQATTSSETTQSLLIDNNLEPFVIDTLSIFRETEKILRQPSITSESPIPLTALQRMQVALQAFRRPQRPNPIVVDATRETVQKSCEEHATKWMSFCKQYAVWMMNCEPFVELPQTEKMLILRNTWFSWIQLERAHQTLKLYGNELRTRQLDVQTFETVMDIDLLSSKPSNSDYLVENYIIAHQKCIQKEILIPMLDLDISEFEVVYMLCILMWSIDGLELSAESERVAERFRDRIGNELHDYYVYTMKQPNYASRLVKLLQIVKANEQILDSRAKTWFLGSFFDSFRVKFTSTELFHPNFYTQEHQH